MSYYASNITREFSSNLEHTSVTGNDGLFFLSNNESPLYNNVLNDKALDTISPSEFYFGNSMPKNSGYTAVQNGTSTVPASSYYNSRNWDNNLRIIDDDEQFERTTENSTLSRDIGGVGSGELGNAGQGLEDGGPAEAAEDPLAIAEDAGAESVEGAETVLEAGEAAEASNPWGIAAIIAQQIGSAINSAMTTTLTNQQTADYQQNINQHGVNVAQNADLIRQNEQQTISSKESAGTIGSFVGPFGALAGRAIAGNTQPNQSVLNTDNSFIGRVDPTDTGIAGSASTAAASGVSSMTDSIDTSTSQ